jgi:trans-aconitate 2-methyltransferase
MSASPFDGAIAGRYDRDSSAQRTAADALLARLAIDPGEDVLDVGCGTGHLVRRLCATSRGRVEGVDPSAAMVAEARRLAPAARFGVAHAEALAFDAEFDVVVCNSALQWFRDPALGVARMRAALRPGGRLGLQAPARSDYVPSFVAAMEEVATHPDTVSTFARFTSPWFFLETAEAYAALLGRAGLVVRSAEIVPMRSCVTPAEAMAIFESAAVAAYLGPACYDVPLDEGYVRRVREIVRGAFERQAGADGRLELVIHRLFAIADR